MELTAGAHDVEHLPLLTNARHLADLGLPSDEKEQSTAHKGNHEEEGKHKPERGAGNFKVAVVEPKQEPYQIPPPMINPAASKK